MTAVGVESMLCSIGSRIRWLLLTRGKCSLAITMSMWPMMFSPSFLPSGEINLLVEQQNEIVSPETVLKAEGGTGQDKIDVERGDTPGEL
jgi:hypothetical protein